MFVQFRLARQCIAVNHSMMFVKLNLRKRYIRFVHVSIHNYAQITIYSKNIGELHG